MNRLAVALLVLGAVCVAAADIEESDGLAEWHDADTPTRQAQRLMLAEREAATAKHAASEEDVLGMRLQAVSTSVEAEADASRPQPHARRISGASKSFTPNDKMCVMCKFLTERMQQDLSIGFGRGFGYAGYAGGFGAPPYAMIAGVPPVKAGGDAFVETGAFEEDQDFVEIESADETEEAAEEETESEDESESEEEDAALIQVEDESAEEEEEEEESDEEESEEAESEEEEEEVDASLVQVSGEDEGEWATPEYTDAKAESPASLLEVASDDFQTPQYIDAVYQTSEEEAEDETASDEEHSADEGTADSSEPAFFESSAIVAQAESGEWTTPEYTGPAATEPIAATESVDAELTGFIQTSEETEWTTPTYSDSAKSESGAKAYARVIVPAEQEQSLLEAAAVETVDSSAAQTSETGSALFAPRTIRSAAAKRRQPVIFHTQRRYRAADGVVPRPRWARMDHHHSHHMSTRLLAGMALRSAEHAAYDKMEAYCSTRLPESYGKYCRPVLRLFRRITDALSYGDSPTRVCLAVELCKPNAYLAQSPHDHLAARN